jgi:lipoyl(octanoyl) transferase
MRLEVKFLGCIDYETCDVLQKNLQVQIIQKVSSDTVLLCSHPPCITKTKSTLDTDITSTPFELVKRGISIIDTDRGGKATYHSPKQLIVYPLLDLNFHKKDVAWFVRNLENVVKDTLSELGISSDNETGKTGVWVNGKKICSVGIRISKWVTRHGFALYLEKENDVYSYFSACGNPNEVFTSIEEESKQVYEEKTIEEIVVRNFKKTFAY